MLMAEGGPDLSPIAIVILTTASNYVSTLKLTNANGSVAFTFAVLRFLKLGLLLYYYSRRPEQQVHPAQLSCPALRLLTNSEGSLSINPAFSTFLFRKYCKSDRFLHHFWD